MHTVVPPDDVPRYALNMWRLTKYIKNKLCIMLVSLYTITFFLFFLGGGGVHSNGLEFLNVCGLIL